MMVIRHNAGIFCLGPAGPLDLTSLIREDLDDLVLHKPHLPNSLTAKLKMAKTQRFVTLWLVGSAKLVVEAPLSASPTAH